MNRRAFLLSALIAPFAAALAPKILCWSALTDDNDVLGFIKDNQGAGFKSGPVEPLSAETIKKAWKDLADAAFETRQHDAAALFNNFP